MTKTIWSRATIGAALVGFGVAIGAVFAPASVIVAGASTDAARELVAVDRHNRALSSSAINQRFLRLSSASDSDLALQARKGLRVGDRITIGGRSGLKRVLEVTTLQRTALSLDNALEDRASQPRAFLIVEARDIERPQLRPVRFLIDEPTARGRDRAIEGTARAL